MSTQYKNRTDPVDIQRDLLDTIYYDIKLFTAASKRGFYDTLELLEQRYEDEKNRKFRHLENLKSNVKNFDKNTIIL